jgi:hypothetical protein
MERGITACRVSCNYVRYEQSLLDLRHEIIEVRRRMDGLAGPGEEFGASKPAFLPSAGTNTLCIIHIVYCHHSRTGIGNENQRCCDIMNGI